MKRNSGGDHKLHKELYKKGNNSTSPIIKRENNTEETIPPILKREAEYEIKELKNKKALGSDNIDNELIKTFGNIINPDPHRLT